MSPSPDHHPRTPSTHHRLGAEGFYTGSWGGGHTHIRFTMLPKTASFSELGGGGGGGTPIPVSKGSKLRTQSNPKTWGRILTPTPRVCGQILESLWASVSPSCLTGLLS